MTVLLNKYSQLAHHMSGGFDRSAVDFKLRLLLVLKVSFRHANKKNPKIWALHVRLLPLPYLHKLSLVANQPVTFRAGVSHQRKLTLHLPPQLPRPSSCVVVTTSMHMYFVCGNMVVLPLILSLSFSFLNRWAELIIPVHFRPCSNYYRLICLLWYAGLSKWNTFLIMEIQTRPQKCWHPVNKRKGYWSDPYFSLVSFC